MASEPAAYRFKSPLSEEGQWEYGKEPPVGSRWEIEPLYTDRSFPRPEYCTTADELEKSILRDEIERLTRALHYEQHFRTRVGTHGPGCYSWGPAHYECALRKIKTGSNT